MQPHLRRPTRARLAAIGAAALAAVSAAVVGASRHQPTPPHRPALAAVAPVTSHPTAPPTAAPPTVAPPPPMAPPATAVPPAATPASLRLAGCPPPPRPAPVLPPPWHPAVLVPDSALPPPTPPDPAAASLAAASGKGLWVWQYRRTEDGDPRSIVERAAAAGLRQLWVRVADSRDGFYGADELSALVPLAHQRGIAVIAWGFPHLYDPAADAWWSIAVLDWRAPGGDGVDGFSADIETSSEGVALSGRRAALYLSLVRPARAGRPLIATVYPPTDHWFAVYPFTAMAPYVDAFAPMIYWECRDPGAAAAEATARLARLRPVHLIGQAFSFGDVGGRIDLPSAAELDRFMTVARRGGAIGASFWVWQSMSSEEWSALSAFRWW